MDWGTLLTPLPGRQLLRLRPPPHPAALPAAAQCSLSALHSGRPSIVASIVERPVAESRPVTAYPVQRANPLTHYLAL